MSTLKGVVSNKTARGTSITVLQLRYMRTIQCLAVSFEEVGGKTERVFKLVLFLILHVPVCPVKMIFLATLKPTCQPWQWIFWIFNRNTRTVQLMTLSTNSMHKAVGYSLTMEDKELMTIVTRCKGQSKIRRVVSGRLIRLGLAESVHSLFSNFVDYPKEIGGIWKTS